MLCPEAMQVFRANIDANFQTILGPPRGGPPLGAGLPPPGPAGPAPASGSGWGSWASQAALPVNGAAGAPGLTLPQVPAPNVAEVEVLQNRVNVLEEEVAGLAQELRELRDAFDSYRNS